MNFEAVQLAQFVARELNRLPGDVQIAAASRSFESYRAGFAGKAKMLAVMREAG